MTGLALYRVTGWSDRLALIDDRVPITIKVDLQHFDEVPRCLPFTPAAFARPAVKGC